MRLVTRLRVYFSKDEVINDLKKEIEELRTVIEEKENKIRAREKRDQLDELERLKQKADQRKKEAQ